MTRKPATIAFWTGRLPHWEVEDGRYFVTMHLTGAIPPEGQERIHGVADESRRLQRHDHDGRLAIHRRVYAEMERWLDRATTVTQLVNELVARMVIDAIHHRQENDWNMLAYVVMPSHLHFFFELRKPGLKKCLESFRRWTGHQAAKILGTEGAGFWQDEWFDHWSRSESEDERIVDYIQENPVKAKLVTSHLDWPHGSWSDIKRDSDAM